MPGTVNKAEALMGYPSRQSTARQWLKVCLIAGGLGGAYLYQPTNKDKLGVIL